MKPVRVLSVASEVFPLVKTGGLADVAGALPSALAAEGVTVRTLVPGYPAVLEALPDATQVCRLGDLPGGPARVVEARIPGLDLFVLDAPHLFARPGNPYLDAQGNPWPDNALRFGALCAAAAAFGRAQLAAFTPDIVHSHDWQAGLVPAYLRYGDGGRARTVMTVHNLAFQGQFPSDLVGALKLPAHALAVDGVEYYGSIGFLKGGLALADRITTVSPTYAMEIQTREAGMGLGGLLRTRAHVLTGILNGIDTTVWNPATDPHIAERFDARRLALRAVDKAALQQRFGLTVNARAFLFGVVGRLTWQKGVDLLEEVLPAIVSSRAQLAVLGAGDPATEARMTAAARAHPGQVAVITGHDEPLAHAVQAGIDALLMPSRFEPCGLSQLCAMRYGAIPVVARVGGLADTVVDANDMALAAGAGTGIQFAPVNADQLEFALDRVQKLARNRAQWHHVQMRAMSTDVGWTRPAKKYAALYRELAAQGAR
jgi:starch synthase